MGMFADSVAAGPFGYETEPEPTDNGDNFQSTRTSASAPADYYLARAVAQHLKYAALVRSALE